MFRTNRRFSLKRKRSRSFRPLRVLLAIPIVLIAAELLLWLAAGDLLRNYEGEPPLVADYRLQFINSQGQPYDGLPQGGRLAVSRSTFSGYELVGDRQGDRWQIDAQGFRSDRPVPAQKPQGEIRIFVFGGSTAFGYLSSSNDTTFASQLETRLNQRVKQQKESPEQFQPAVLPYLREDVDKALARPPRIRAGNYRAVNAAVPGYASGNELAQLATQIIQYNPDVAIVVDGYADLMLPSDREAVDIPGTEELLEDAPTHFYRHLSQQVRSWIDSTYLIKGIQYWILKPHQRPLSRWAPQLSVVGKNPNVPLSDYLADDKAEIERRVNRYLDRLRQMSRLTQALNIPLIAVVQPELTTRPEDRLSATERAVLNRLGPQYAQHAEASYQLLSQNLEQLKGELPNNVKLLDLSKLYQDFEGQAFQDAVHLTDEASSVLSDRLYQNVTRLFLLQPKPYGQS